jgi:tetratricopeptide (TPR) repeat protein
VTARPRSRAAARRPSTSDRPRPPRANVVGWPLLAVLLAATLLAYQPAWHGGLLWDDDAHITRSDLRAGDGLKRIWLEPGATQQYYPLLHSAFWLLHRLWGTDTLGYHVVSITLHAFSAFLLALVLGRLAVPWPWLAALVFALHPVHVESVAWISELKNTLSGALALAAALAYLAFDRTRRRTMYGLALGLFVLALLSKTVTAAVPALLLIVVWWQRGRVEVKRDLVPLVPLFALGLAFGAFTVWVERTFIGARGAGFDLTLLDRLVLAGRAAWFYLGKLVWPTDLVFTYPRWDVNAGIWWQYLYPAALVLLLAGAWLWRSRSQAPLAALLCYLAALAPALGFVNVYPFRYAFVADHFQYLASIAVIALATGAAATLAARFAPHRRWTPAAAAFVVVVPLGLLTWQQSHDYVSEEALYRATIRRNPSSWIAHNNLAVLKLGSSVDEAMTHLDQALRLNPDYPEAHDNRGLALQLLGRYEEAAAEHAAALRLEPAFAEAHNNLGSALQKLGRLDEAADHYRAVIRLRPQSPQGHANLGNAFLALGRLDEAVRAYERALQLEASLVDVRYNLAAALMGLGRHEEALRGFRDVLRTEPGSADAHAHIGTILERTGRFDEAVAHFEASVRLQPRDARARLRLGHSLYRRGEWQRAAAEYAESLAIDPASAEAHNNLGACLERLGRLDEAIPHYEEAARLLPRSAEARANLRRARAAAAGRGAY